MSHKYRLETQHNVIPDRCDFVVDIRTNDHYTNKEVVDILKKQIPCDITPRSLRLNSSRIELSHPFVQRAIIAGKQPFGSPTLSDQALMPFPSVKIGPAILPVLIRQTNISNLMK